jgi:serine/threonine protein kinase
MGPYELLEPIGRGGMGVVYRGRHEQTGQTVAVKVMAADMAADPLLFKRFEQEASAARRLRHPHIVQGLEFGLHNDQPYLVMELVEGENLGQRVKRLGRIPEAEAVSIALQIADALELAHRHQLIHRDVKPENILLTKDGQAKLTDLGLLKDLAGEGNLTRTRTILGTMAYMAPEQLTDAKNVDHRCDVYGLGVTVYFALTGVVPFQGPGNLTICRKKLANDFVRPRQVVPSLSAQVECAICRALDAAPDRRPASCAEFAAMLTGAIPLEPCAAAEQPLQPLPAADQVEPTPPPPRENRRAAPRYPSAVEARCWPLQNTSHRWDAEVQDVSLTGIRLELDRRFEPGSVLTVAVSDSQWGSVSTWLVRVRWVRAGAAKKWLIGCAFVNALCEDDLHALLENRPTTVVLQEEEEEEEDEPPTLP